MNWVGRIELAVHVLTEENGAIINAHGRDRTWLLQFLFPGREEVSKTRDFAADYGLTFDIKSINGMKANRAGRFGLTEQQYETITAALERGYYESPRDTTAEDLAGEVGISRQAFAERLWRGQRASRRTRSRSAWWDPTNAPEPGIVGQSRSAGSDRSVGDFTT